MARRGQLRTDPGIAGCKLQALVKNAASSSEAASGLAHWLFTPAAHIIIVLVRVSRHGKSAC
jgi:hypothetical protein